MTLSDTQQVSRHLPWHDLQQRILQGVPFVHRIPSLIVGTPPSDISIAEGGEEIRIWLPCGAAAKLLISPLKDIDFAVVKRQQEYGIEIRSRARVLFQEIYNFFVSIVDKIHLESRAPEIAVEETVERWRELLRSQMLMSDEVQLGLYGELWLLKQLSAKFGDLALDAWTGPHRQSHDFRIGNVEFEVKATRGNTHVHVINGLNQLEPSGGRDLYLLSLRVELAGAGSGTTLPEEIFETGKILSKLAHMRFLRLLREAYGYDPVHDSSYQTRLQLADSPRLIPVLDTCPRLTRDMLSQVPLIERIGDVRYRANFEGLGIPQDDSMFSEILLPSSI